MTINSYNMKKHNRILRDGLLLKCRFTCVNSFCLMFVVYTLTKGMALFFKCYKCERHTYVRMYVHSFDIFILVDVYVLIYSLKSSFLYN